MFAKKSVFNRGVAWVACFFFTLSLFPEAYAALPALELAISSERPKTVSIDIPTSLASVEEWYQAPARPDPKMIVHIQDAHANYEAQAHIRDLLHFLSHDCGFKTILVEGAAETLDPNYLKLFPDKEKNLQLMDALARAGEVTGTEMFLMEDEESMRGIGIEKPELYRANYEALVGVYQADEFAHGFFEAYESKLGQVASRTFGPRMIQALNEWRKFESGHREFLPFISQLGELSKRVLDIDLNMIYSQIEWPQLTRILVLQKIEKEFEKGDIKERALEEKRDIADFLKTKNVSTGLIEALDKFDEKNTNLNRIGSSEAREAGAARFLIEMLVEEGGKIGFDIRDYPAFAKYAGYLIVRSEIVPGALFEEIQKLFDRLLEKLVVEAPSVAQENDVSDAERRRLLLLYRDIILAKKLMRLELTRDEWLLVLQRQDRYTPEDFNRRMREVLGQNVQTQKESSEALLEDLKKLKAAFNAAFRFYRAATNREDYFFQKMQETLAKTDKAVLITGGFHADGMKSLMRKYDISYGTLTPRITQELSSDLYRKVMMVGAEASSGLNLATNAGASDKLPADLLMAGGNLGGKMRAELRQAIVRAEAQKMGLDEKQTYSEVRQNSGFQQRARSEARKGFFEQTREWIKVPHRMQAVSGAGLAFLAVPAAFFALWFTSSVGFFISVVGLVVGGAYGLTQARLVIKSVAHMSKAGDRDFYLGNAGDGYVESFDQTIGKGRSELREVIVSSNLTVPNVSNEIIQKGIRDGYLREVGGAVRVDRNKLNSLTVSTLDVFAGHAHALGAGDLREFKVTGQERWYSAAEFLGLILDGKVEFVGDGLNYFKFRAEQRSEARLKEIALKLEGFGVAKDFGVSDVKEAWREANDLMVREVLLPNEIESLQRMRVQFVLRWVSDMNMAYALFGKPDVESFIDTAIEDATELLQSAITNETKNRVMTDRVQLVRAKAETKKDLPAPSLAWSSTKVVSRVEISSSLQKILNSISFDEMENIFKSLQAEKMLPEDVVVFVAYGFVNAEEMSSAQWGRLGEMISKLNRAIAVDNPQLMEMIKTLFPSLISQEAGHLIFAVTEEEWMKTDRAQVLQLYAALNPKVQVNVLVDAERRKPIEKLAPNIHLHYVKGVRGAQTAIAKLKLRDGLWSRVSLVAFSETYAVEVGDLRLDGREGYQVVVEEKHDNNLAAGFALFKNAKMLSSRSAVRGDDQSGIDKSDKKRWKITKASLGLIANIVQAYQAAWQVMKSA